MAKYKHTEEVKIVLADLENRIQQLIEANMLYMGREYDELIKQQNIALGSVITLIQQIRNTGHVKRGTPVVPDDLEPIVKTKWNNQPQLGLSELMTAINTKVKEAKEK